MKLLKNHNITHSKTRRVRSCSISRQRLGSDTVSWENNVSRNSSCLLVQIDTIKKTINVLPNRRYLNAFMPNSRKAKHEAAQDDREKTTGIQKKNCRSQPTINMKNGIALHSSSAYRSATCGFDSPLAGCMTD